MPKLTRLIIKDCFLVPMTNPRQLSDFFDFALEVEGVKAEIPVEQTTGVRGVYTLPAYEFAGDLMRNDKPNTFVNEWYLGTMGEFAMDDLGKLDASLRNLSS